jgi:phosphonate ABC transporter permease subunit PhnE
VRIFLIVIATVLLYAYATEVTQINFEEPRSPDRQAVTTRVIRALARPDLFEYQEETRSMNITIRMPCPEEKKASQIGLEDRALTLTPNCATTTQDELKLTGTGFRPRTSGIVRWYPPGEVQTTRALTSFRVDVDGNFEAEFTMSDIRPTEEPQRIEVEEKWRLGGFLGTGIVGWSDASETTFEKIIETIFLALMATTVGTVLAIPISFVAARNLMTSVGSPLAAIMSGVIALPIGAWIGSRLTTLMLSLAAQVSENATVGVVVAVAAWGAAWIAFTVGPPVFSDEPRSRQQEAIALARLIASSLLVFFGLGALANSGAVFGGWLQGQWSSVGFLGGFIFLVSDGITVLSPGLIGLALGLVAASFGSRYGQELILRVPEMPGRIFTGITSAIGGAVFVLGLFAALNWLYQYDEPELVRDYPAIIVAVVMLGVGLLVRPKRAFPVGLALYSVMRSTLNVIRSIEPLIYVIVFAVWVGIGPFAGVLALTGHTIAALGKLFSEQVENIAEGPVEAVTATGANSIQTIVFGVIPQIVPPYIAFTLYRWDINVRFSTVIGFGGGGGIGLVLTQNIQLLRYRQASVMMIAIAVVVMLLDYISSQIRTRII